MNNPTIPAAGPVFQEGDRVVCADGVARIVRAMAPLIPGEAAHVVVEDGTQWITANCRRANPADLACARQASAATAARIRQDPDPDDPQWRAALADLSATHDFLKVAETNGAIRADLARGETEAARELEELEHRTAPAESEGERALREEAAALFVVLSHDGQAHGFEPVRARGADRPVAWTYRTGFAHDARFGWVLAGGRLRTEHAEAVYRWQAEDAASAVLTLTARGEGDTSIVDALAHASLDDLREALERLRDRAARTRGTSPIFVLDEDVTAALKVLAACHFAEVPHDFNANVEEGAEGHDPEVTGLVVEPAGGGHVTAYWVERGRYVTSNGAPFMAQLRDIRRKFQDAGWETVPGTRRVVTAYRPTT
jgi:hypothetical protein